MMNPPPAPEKLQALQLKELLLKTATDKKTNPNKLPEIFTFFDTNKNWTM